MKQTITLPPEAAGKRLDIALAAATAISRSQLQKRIREGLVRIDGQVADSKYSLTGGEAVVIEASPVADVPSVPSLPILYEDDDVLIIDKPAGLVVHVSESGRAQPTVAAFALAHGVHDSDPTRPGIVHRLDKDTSGVMVLAKHPEAKTALQRQFRHRTIGKTYTALVRGRLSQSEAIINLPIGRDRKRPVKRAVVPGSRAALTQYRVIGEYPGASLVEVDLQTGRTHQIRVHFSHIGHPVIGDTLYGDTSKTAGLSRQFLHASKLSLVLPTGKPIVITSPLPSDLQDYLNTLESDV